MGRGCRAERRPVVEAAWRRRCQLDAGCLVCEQKREKHPHYVSGADGKLYMRRLPETVPAFDVRTQFSKWGFNVLAEYAWKINDPSFDNGYSYDRGSAALLSASYSGKGYSILFQAKRSENMSYRSDRDMTGTSSFINHLPAFAYQHTYALPAMYPYATQPLGEWAYQGEVRYTFPRRSALADVTEQR